MAAPSASHISRLLREGGLPRASEYKTFGRDVDGFIVMAPSQYATARQEVTVTFSTRRGEAAEQCVQAIEILAAAGFDVRENGNNGVGGTYLLYVKRVS